MHNYCVGLRFVVVIPTCKYYYEVQNNNQYLRSNVYLKQHLITYITKIYYILPIFIAWKKGIKTAIAVGEV